MAQQDELDEAARVHLLYELLVDQVVVGRNTIIDELDKPKADQDVHYLMAQVELNAGLEQAVVALVRCGLIDDEALLCMDCGAPVMGHDDDVGPGHLAPPKLEPPKPN